MHPTLRNSRTVSALALLLLQIMGAASLLLLAGKGAFLFINMAPFR